MRRALIVIDLIEDYFDQEIWPQSRIPSQRKRLTQHTNELVGICRRAGIPIVWMRQEFEPDMSNAFAHAKREGMTYARRGTAGSALLSELDVHSSDLVIAKHRFSAFFDTDLDAVLRDLEIDQVIVAGITTSWCVRSTVVDAYQYDLDPIVATDCVDAFSATDHDSSIQAMNGYVARCLDNRELSEIVRLSDSVT